MVLVLHAHAQGMARLQNKRGLPLRDFKLFFLHKSIGKRSSYFKFFITRLHDSGKKQRDFLAKTIGVQEKKIRQFLL